MCCNRICFPRSTNNFWTIYSMYFKGSIIKYKEFPPSIIFVFAPNPFLIIGNTFFIPSKSIFASFSFINLFLLWSLNFVILIIFFFHFLLIQQFLKVHYKNHLNLQFVHRFLLHMVQMQHLIY